ncbi:MAG: hypothetical protein L0Y39_12920 [Methylococcaceae bacterium]|nr:hypothetical protein [Methylococcaceae bacterium]
MTRGNEAYSRVVTDAQLKDQGWNVQDQNSVRYEYVLPDTGRRFQDEKQITITTLQSMVSIYGDYSSGYFGLIIAAMNATAAYTANGAGCSNTLTEFRSA